MRDGHRLAAANTQLRLPADWSREQRGQEVQTMHPGTGEMSPEIGQEEEEEDPGRGNSQEPRPTLVAFLV